MSGTLLRAFPAEMTMSGQRTLTGRLVPYDTETDVMDVVDGKNDIYREGFRRGAFAPQAGSKEPGVLRRIGLIHKHDGGLGFLGPFTALREEADGLWGDVSILRSKAGDVEDLLSAGVEELSVEFRLPGRSNTEVINGVRWRTRAHLDAVALEAKGAYSGARVLAFRAELDELTAEKDAELKAEEEKAAAEQATRDQIAADAEKVAERKRAWDEMVARYDIEHAKQDTLVRSYGLTVPPHEGLPIHGY